MQDDHRPGPTGHGHDARWVAAPGVVTTELSEGLALLDTRTETYFTLNPTGAHVWSLLDRGRTVPQLAEALAQRFGAPPGACREDVAGLLDDLAGNGLVVPDEDGPHG